MLNECLEIAQPIVSMDISPTSACELPHATAALRTGATVLELGSGDGAYSCLAALVVGESGCVIGVETTPDMVSQARANVVQNGLGNVSFRLGELEYLPMANQTADVIISHYGIHPSAGKTQVFREAFRALKPGGHFTFVDMVAMQVLPEEEEVDVVGYAEDLAGVIMLDDLEDMLRAAGFEQIRSYTQPSCHKPTQVPVCDGALNDMITPALLEAVKPASSMAVA